MSDDDDVLYSDEFDAYYNATTGEWLEKRCSDTNCEFCKDRPLVAKVDDEKKVVVQFEII